MLNHYRGTGGYALLYLCTIFGVILLTLIVAGIFSTMGFFENVGAIAGGVILAAFWIVGFIVMQRFIAIESRRPSLSESNIIGIKSVLYVFIPIFCMLLLVFFIAIIAKLFGVVGGGAKEASQAAQTAEGAGQTQKAIGALWGILGTMFLLYMAPFLNLALLSRLVSPGSKTA